MMIKPFFIEIYFLTKVKTKEQVGNYENICHNT